MECGSCHWKIQGDERLFRQDLFFGRQVSSGIHWCPLAQFAASIAKQTSRYRLAIYKWVLRLTKAVLKGPSIQEFFKTKLTTIPPGSMEWKKPFHVYNWWRRKKWNRYRSVRLTQLYVKYLFSSYILAVNTVSKALGALYAEARSVWSWNIILDFVTVIGYPYLKTYSLL